MSLTSAIASSIRRRSPRLAEALRHLRRNTMAAISRVVPLRWIVAAQYRLRNGTWPDLDRPRDFSEKLCASKLADATDLEVQCADKVLVRDYVAACIGADYLVPMILSTPDASRIAPDVVAATRFVVKANHDSGTVIICRDRATFDWKSAQDLMRSRLAINFYYDSFEPQYRHIKPQLIVEEFLSTGDGSDLVDYKLFCFGGEPAIIQADVDRSTNHSRAFFDTAWHPLDATLRYPRPQHEVPRPDALEELLNVARKLSAPFPFARVDLYVVDGKVWFGEITFRPEAGLSRFEPPEWERKLGDLLEDGAAR